MVNVFNKNIYFGLFRFNKNYSTNSLKKHYEILEVSNTSSKEEIKEAYYKMAKIYHPDSSKSGQIINENFINIKKAYEELIKKIDRDEEIRKLNEIKYNNNIDNVIENLFINKHKNSGSTDNFKNKKIKFYPVYGIYFDYYDLQTLKYWVNFYKEKAKRREIKKNKISFHNQNINININTFTAINGINITSILKKDTNLQIQSDFYNYLFKILTKTICLGTVTFCLTIQFGTKGVLASLYVVYLSLF
jgi:hypothetical protein